VTTPGPYALILLALGAMRLTRLIGWDSITDRVRAPLTGWHSDGRRHQRDRRDRERGKRWMLFLACPWCLGFWVCLACWGSWQVWPRGTLVAMAPLALSAIVGLAVKNLDE
jgi:hypothetical protein